MYFSIYTSLDGKLVSLKEENARLKLMKDDATAEIKDLKVSFNNNFIIPFSYWFFFIRLNIYKRSKP